MVTKKRTRKRRPKIDPSSLPELKGLTIVRTQAEFDAFVGKLRQDYYSKKSKDITELQANFDLWMKSEKPGVVTFFAVEDEPDDFAKNDDWGHYTVFQCIATWGEDERVHVMKDQLETLYH